MKGKMVLVIVGLIVWAGILTSVLSHKEIVAYPQGNREISVRHPLTQWIWVFSVFVVCMTTLKTWWQYIIVIGVSYWFSYFLFWMVTFA